MTGLEISLLVWVLLGLLVLAIPVAEAATLYVAPNGHDAWSGRLERPNAAKTDGPLASLQGARDAVRRLKAAGPLTAPVRVVFATGTYPLMESVRFGAEDSGAEKCPVSYEAAPGAKPVFSGGRAIKGFQPGPDGVWTAQLPEVKAGDWYFEQLWVNGKRATRARTPNKFYFYMLRKVKLATDPLTGQDADLSHRAFIARREDIMPLRSIPKERLRDVTLVVYHSWETSRHRLAGVDPETNMVVTTGPAPWGFLDWGPTQRYHVENLREALDEPGEWFLDRDGTLYYKPLPGEDVTTAEVIAPVGAEEFVRFVGQPQIGLPVEYITFKGLAFRHGQYILPEGGHGDGQAEVTVPAAITAEGANHIVLQDCELAHVGISGLWFRLGSHDCLVQRCNIHDIGATGVKIGDGWGIELSDPTTHTHHIVVDNNIIHSAARIHHGAIGVWVGHSGDNRVTHNDISDLYYTGISAGWSWGYAETLSKRNTIDFNHIHHCGWGMLSDMGGVYTLGLADGTTVSNNVIHDIYSYDRYGRGGWGLYNDEGTSRITMENNLVYNVKTGTYHQHYGEANLVQNNIFALSMDGQIQRSRMEEHLSFTYRHNLVYWKDGPLVTAGSIKNQFVKFESNLYWKEGGEPFQFMDQTLEQRQADGQDVGSIVADPGFVDADHFDFHLKPNSPALTIGFKPFDYTKAGLYGDAAWVNIPQQVEYPPVEFAPEPPPPPPLVVNDDFEKTPVGQPPSDAQANVENKGDAIVVTDETAAGGKHSLKIQDAPGLQFVFNPHLVYTPNYTAGVGRCSFDMRIEEGVVMYQEWRSWDVNPYCVGASLWIQKGKLQVGGQDLLDLPVGQWFHVEVSEGIGANADGKWNLTITLPGQEPKRFEGLANGSPDFKNLTWVGWSSMATEKTVFYLDNIKITNE